LIGETLFWRFEWFNGANSGYGFLKIMSEDKLEGGWWLEEQVPKRIKGDITLISRDIVPGMIPFTWARMKQKTNEPPEIQDYFREKRKSPPK